MTKRQIIGIVIIVFVLVGSFIGLGRWGGNKVAVAKPTVAQYITLETHAYFEKGELTTQQFQARVVTYAANLINTYESVTIRYYIDEHGGEKAVVVSSKRQYR